MFQQILRMGQPKFNIDTNIYTIDYELTDSKFIEKISLTVNKATYRNIASNILQSLAAIYCYIRRGREQYLYTAKNIAIFYALTINPDYKAMTKWAYHDQKLMDLLFPELEYGAKYYKCIANSIKKIEFSGANKIIHNAKYITQPIL